MDEDLRLAASHAYVQLLSHADTAEQPVLVTPGTFEVIRRGFERKPKELVCADGVMRMTTNAGVRIEESPKRNAWHPDLRLIGLPAGWLEPTLEFRFNEERKWRFDYAWQDRKVAIEIHGGLWVHGRHTSGAGLKDDMAKRNAAVIEGWKILEYERGRWHPLQKVDWEQVAKALRAAKEGA